MESNICCTARAAPASSTAPAGLAPVAGIVIQSLAALIAFDGFQCGTKHFHVEKVLLSATCELVADQVVPGDDIGRDLAVNLALHAMRPCFVESDSINAL